MDPQYQQFINEAAQKYGLDPNMLMAMMAQESGGNPNAVSSAGAQGLMQLMPGTARDMGVTNPMNPQQNINGGAQYISQMLQQFGGNIPQALGAYNWGPGNMQRKGMGQAPQETQNYIDSIMQRWQPPIEPQNYAGGLGGGWGSSEHPTPIGDIMQGMNVPQPQVSPQASMPSPTGAMQGNIGMELDSLAAPSSPGIGVGMAEPKTAMAGYPGAQAASSGIGSQIGQFFQSPMGLPTLMGVMGTDWSSPESIGANVGSIGGTAAATGIPAVAGALGSMAGPVGAVVGGLLGGGIGSAFGGGEEISLGPGQGSVTGKGTVMGDMTGGLLGKSSKKDAEEKLKKKQKQQFMLSTMQSMTDNLKKSGYDRRVAMENIARQLAL